MRAAGLTHSLRSARAARIAGLRRSANTSACTYTSHGLCGGRTVLVCHTLSAASVVAVRAFSSSSTLLDSAKSPASPSDENAGAEGSKVDAARRSDDASSVPNASRNDQLPDSTAEHKQSASPSDQSRERETKEAPGSQSKKMEEAKHDDAAAAVEKAAKDAEKRAEAKPTDEVAEEAVSAASYDSAAEVRRKKERLLDADKSLRIEEVFSQEHFQRFIHTTEVSTTAGLRWLDVSASPEFFQDPLMAHVPEGQFAYSVMRKLFGSGFPIGVYASVASGAALPATYLDENWACLILRSTKESFRVDDDVVGLLSTDRRYHSGGDAVGYRRHWRLASAGKRWHDSPRDYDVDTTPMTAGGGVGEYCYDDATDKYYPRHGRLSQQWRRRLTQFLRPRRQDTASPSGTPAVPSSGSSEAESTTAAAAAEAAEEEETAVAALLRYRSRHRSRGRSSYRSPLTMSDFTDRLTVFIGKELHPVEEDFDAAPDTSATDASTLARDGSSSSSSGPSLVLSLDVDRMYGAKSPRKSSSSSSSGGDVPAGSPPSAPSSSTAATPNVAADSTAERTTRYDVRWRVITVHRHPISFIRDLQSQWNKLTSRGGRPVRSVRTVPSNDHGGADAEELIKKALRKAARPPSMVEEEEEEEEEDGGEGQPGDAYTTMVDRVETWEDLVRLLYHGAARTLQESAYRNTRRLEMMETEIFDASDNSAQHLRAMTRLMAELHLLSRKATIHNAILRESKVAYQKLKRALEHPVDLADQRELLYVDSVLSISAHLEEQSESLLFLQFSVAMNQTEQHLRTLTIFSTLFIPLDFIVTCCGSNIESLHRFNDSKPAMYAVFAVMATTAVLTMRWIRRTLR